MSHWCDTLLTCHFIWHLSIVCEVFSFNQHQLRTFLLSIGHRHQLVDTPLPCHIVTGDYDVLLLYTWWYESHLEALAQMFFYTFFFCSFYSMQVYLTGLLSVQGFWSFPPEHRSSLGQNAKWLCVHVLAFYWCLVLKHTLYVQQLPYLELWKSYESKEQLSDFSFRLPSLSFQVYLKQQQQGGYVSVNPRNCSSTRFHPPHPRCFPSQSS